jgi:hypothetical protein
MILKCVLVYNVNCIDLGQIIVFMVKILKFRFGKKKSFNYRLLVERSV